MPHAPMSIPLISSHPPLPLGQAPKDEVYECRSKCSRSLGAGNNVEGKSAQQQAAFHEKEAVLHLIPQKFGIPLHLTVQLCKFRTHPAADPEAPPQPPTPLFGEYLKALGFLMPFLCCL